MSGASCKNYRAHSYVAPSTLLPINVGRPLAVSPSLSPPLRISIFHYSRPFSFLSQSCLHFFFFALLYSVPLHAIFLSTYLHQTALASHIYTFLHLNLCSRSFVTLHLLLRCVSTSQCTFRHNMVKIREKNFRMKVV